MYFIMHQEYFFFQDLKLLKSLGLFQNRFLDDTPHGLVMPINPNSSLALNSFFRWHGNASHGVVLKDVLNVFEDE